MKRSVASKIILLACLAAIHFNPCKADTLVNWETPVFNFKAYEELKRKDPESTRFTVEKPDDISIRYAESDDEYKDYFDKHKVFTIIRSYYKPSGIIKSERTDFHGIDVNNAIYYDEGGHEIERVLNTPPDWVDRITEKVKNEFHVDLWKWSNAMLIKRPYQGRPVVLLMHLKGTDLNLRAGDPLRYFALLDFVTLETVATGEIHQRVLNPDADEPQQIVETRYMVEGKEIFFDY